MSKVDGKCDLEYMTMFINGKQKRVKRPKTIEGMDADELIRRNADPIWLHENEMWEYMNTEESEEADGGEAPSVVPFQPEDRERFRQPWQGKIRAGGGLARSAFFALQSTSKMLRTNLGKFVGLEIPGENG